jgi:hypothetical protein
MGPIQNMDAMSQTWKMLVFTQKTTNTMKDFFTFHGCQNKWHIQMTYPKPKRVQTQ